MRTIDQPQILLSRELLEWSISPVEEMHTPLMWGPLPAFDYVPRYSVDLNSGYTSEREENDFDSRLMSDMGIMSSTIGAIALGPISPRHYMSLRAQKDRQPRYSDNQRAYVPPEWS